MFVRNTLTALSLAAAVAVISVPASAAEDVSLRLAPQQTAEPHQQTVQTQQVNTIRDNSLRIVQPAPENDVGERTIQTFVADLFSTDPARQQTATAAMNYDVIN